MPIAFSKVPGFLTERMGNMGGAIVESILVNYGKSNYCRECLIPTGFRRWAR